MCGAPGPTSLTSSLSDTTHPPTLYTVNSYNPLGEITSATYGKTGSGTTATAHTATFDNRGRLLTINDAVTTGAPYSLAVSYVNGRVASANDSINGNWSSFQYDEYGRLKSSTCTANCPGSGSSLAYTYDYDEYGNRWHETVTAGTGYTTSTQFDNNNHLTPTNCTSGAGNYCYDGPGNLFYDGLGGAWSYDAEGRVFAYSSSSASATYTYDALGQRSHRVLSGVVSDYVFDNHGRENTKYSGGFSGLSWSNLYFGASHVATYASSSTYFSHTDHLGSERMETDPTGNTNASAETNQPFGEWTSSGMQNGLGFTGDLLDKFDGNAFHTPNRQYSPTQGRWMRPDPAGMAAVNPMDPQSWNRYAYVGNSPVSYSDPSGLKRPAFTFSPAGGCLTCLYMATGGSAYGVWVNNYIQTQIAAGFVQYGSQNPIYSYQNSNMEFKAFGASATIVGGDNDSGLNASVDTIDATGGGQAGYWYVSGYSGQDIGDDDNLIAQNQSPQNPANNGNNPSQPVKPFKLNFPNVPPGNACNKYPSGPLRTVCNVEPNSPTNNCVRGDLLDRYDPINGYQGGIRDAHCELLRPVE